MKFILFFIGAIYCAMLACNDCFGQTPVYQWVRTPKYKPQSHSAGKSVMADSEGNFYTTGTFRGQMIFGYDTINASYDEMFIAKYNAGGVLQWATQAINGAIYEPAGIGVDKYGNSYIAGTCGNTITIGGVTATANIYNGALVYIAKLDTDGKVLWIKTSETPATTLTVTALAVDEDGEVSITGGCDSKLVFGNVTALPVSKDADFFIVHLDKDGVCKWAKFSGGGKEYDDGHCITTDKQGNIYVGGGHQVTAFFETDAFVSEGFYDAVAMKYNKKGNLQWIIRQPGTGYGEFFNIKADKWGNVYTTTYYFGNLQVGDYQFYTNPSPYYSNLILSKYNASGVLQWTSRLSSPYEEHYGGLDIDSLGDVYLAGSFGLTLDVMPITLKSKGFDNGFVVKYSPQGAVLWAMAVGGAGNHYTSNIVVLEPDVFAITGRMEGAVANFNDIEVRNSTYSTAYLAKLGKNCFAGISTQWASVCPGQVFKFGERSLDTAGTYTRVIMGGKGCDSTLEIKLQMAQAPEIKLTGDTAMLPGSYAQVQLSGATSYIWEPRTGMDNYTSSTPTFRLSNTTQYTVTGYSGVGCTTEKLVTIHVLENEGFMPTLVTPNNDGINDELGYSQPEALRTINCKVFNRWGGQVYASNNPYFKWNGSNESPGVYYYTIKGTFKNGLPINARGSITLMK